MGRKTNKKLGVLGGMGTEATAAFFSLIARKTRAEDDHGHITMIVLNDPQIPDRTRAILHGAPSPLPRLRRGVRWLERSGADLIAIPCNTAHHYLAELRRSVQTPIIDMIAETSRWITDRHPEIKTLGLLATSGTVNVGLFREPIGAQGISLRIPDRVDQDRIMEAIYGPGGLKAGHRHHPLAVLTSIGEQMITQGCDAILSGCTEISSLFTDASPPFTVVNSLHVLVRACILQSGKTIRE